MGFALHGYRGQTENQEVKVKMYAIKVVRENVFIIRVAQIEWGVLHHRHSNRDWETISRYVNTGKENGSDDLSL